MTDRSQPLPARDKLAFFLALVPFLAARDRVSVQETAEHFGVDEDFVRTAVRTLTLNGIPGETATYQHDDLFDIAWDDFEQNDEIVLTNLVALDDSPRFSGREAAALIAGLQYLAALPEYAASRSLSALAAKLARGAAPIANTIAIDQSAGGQTLRLIREAVARGRRIRFDYRSAKGEKETREVDPLQVESLDDSWYLRGWCHLREGLRTFRLDRITAPLITDTPIDEGVRGVPLPEALFEGSPDDISATIELPSTAVGLLADYRPQLLAEHEGVATVSLTVPHTAGLVRLIAGLGGLARITSPPDARASVAGWAAEALAAYP